MFFFNNSSGYVLYIVLVVLAIVGTLGYITFTDRGQARMLAARELKKIQTSLLAESGLTKAEYFMGGGDPKGILWETKGVTDSIAGHGTIHLEAMRFGAFAKVLAAGSRQGMSCDIAGIAGRDIIKEMRPVLTLTGGIPGLIIEDNTAIKGNIVLSGGYLYRGKNRQPVKGAEKWVSIRKSPRLPFDVTPIKTYIDTLSCRRISLLSGPKVIQGNVTLDKSNDTLIGKRDSLVVLGNCAIINVKIEKKTIICAGFLSIADSAECTESSFLAESLEVKAATTGLCLFYSDKNLKVTAGSHNSQFISTDTIFVAKDAKFGELTVWLSYCTLKKDTLKTGGVVFSENGNYSGCCLCFQDSLQKAKRIADMAVVSLGKKSSFKGSIITDGNVDINADTITGHVWASLIKTTGENKMQYINYLFKSGLSLPSAEPPFLLVGSAPVKLNIREARKEYGNTAPSP
jgi:hypothetical protein